MRSWSIPDIKVLRKKLVPATNTVIQILAALVVDRTEGNVAPVVCEHAA